MRIIKFRGKRVDNGEWLIGDLIHYGKTTCIAPIEGDWFDFVSKNRLVNAKYQVVPETVGQFTGLTDKNGKEIFEGDICHSESYYIGDFQYKSFNGKVVFIDGCYILDGMGKDACELDKTTIYNNDIEVIGNIHENGDLL